MDNGFFRVASAVHKVGVADCEFNTKNIISLCKSVNDKNVDVIVFPEMSITAYTCGDLFHSSILIESAQAAIGDIAKMSADLSMAIVIGAPLIFNNALYNCAIVISAGKVIAAIPKSYIPNYNEFYEKRWWESGLAIDAITTIAGFEVPLSTQCLIDIKGVLVSIEICEDLWSPIPPSSCAAMAGAQVIFNLSASNDLIGKYDYLLSLIKQQSARCIAGYVYSGAGYGESSTDLVFDGKAIVAENGIILTKNERWQSENQYVIADIDIDAINHDRVHSGVFNDCSKYEISQPYKIIKCHTNKSLCDTALYRSINPHPFVPKNDNDIDNRCEEIINIQVAGLAKRLEATNTKSLVVGISGGLDSTLALLVATKCFDRLSLDRKGIIGVTMPGFGTTGRTHSNASSLMQALGVSIREISIVPAVNQHFKDISHDASVHDVTYENSQARERTQLLMDIANQIGGMVLGTGDLSELALGWATYNGDHMSMYGVNAGIPKTLVKYLVRWFAIRAKNAQERDILNDIIDTPISPELVPADENGDIRQKTEDLVGPYELHDFFLYYVLRFGFSPKRIFFLAQKAFSDKYATDEIRHWLKTFFKRFFSQQFKRSCLPDGPKIGSVCLSPRGDWRMPSDASPALWLKECDTL